MSGMIKALIKTTLLIVLVVVLAQAVPFVERHEIFFIIMALAIGLFGLIARMLLVFGVLIAVVGAYFLHLL
jgi:hypothetical protein